MPVDGTPTRNAILESAKKEFLINGFSGANLRKIATGAGVTTGALYRHYADKSAIFEALVGSVREEVLCRHTNQTHEYIRMLESQGMDPMWDRDGWGPSELVIFMYDHFDEFKLLLTESGHGEYEDFAHALINLEVESSVLYITAAKKLGYPVKLPSQQELHMIANAQFSAYFELILHDVQRDDAIKYAETMNRFFAAGWKDVIMCE